MPLKLSVSQIVALGVALSAALAIAALVTFIVTLPPQDKPWAKLDLERPMGWATEVQFMRMSGDRAACSEALAASSLRVRSIEDRREGEGGMCGYSNAYAVEQSVYPYSAPVLVSCPLTAALYVWEREVVAPASALLESPVARIEMIGAYSCRRIYGRAEGRVSEHATANAIDISGFRLENGRVVSVLEAWDSTGPDAEFLRAVRGGGCRLFRGVLSPDYNAAHADHLHLDMGPYDICR